MKEYTVQPGDTLKSIAASQLGDEQLESYLIMINSIPSPYKLSPGDVILVDEVEVEGSNKKFWIGVAVAALIIIIWYYKSLKS